MTPMDSRIIKLPARSDGAPSPVMERPRQLVIVGANGAGKTRFAAQLAQNCGSLAYRLNALRALYDLRLNDTSPGSLDSLYLKAIPRGRQLTGEVTQFERVLGLLLHDEMVNLFKSKASQREGHPKPQQAAPTNLDRVIEIWEEVFPGNRILTENGEILFRSGSHDEAFSPVRLSAGEKAVIYYVAAALYAPRNAVVTVEEPELFLHPSLMQGLWNRIELLRPDCLFAYTTHDLEFASSRSRAVTVWVQGYDARYRTWQYEVLPEGSALADETYLTIIGSRKPVLFIEGDGVHSIDAKLYPLIFKDYSVRSLGSCNKVIEATRTFNDLKGFHHVDSRGIVDRDRRDAQEVAYLRRKKVMVPEVAEVENILMLEPVIRTVAATQGKSPDKVFAKVRASVMEQFAGDIERQALQHTRHRIKKTVEYRIDGRFSSIDMLEQHLRSLIREINPRHLYESLCKEFADSHGHGDYLGVLRVYNEKSMLPSSNVAGLCGLRSKDEYIATVIDLLTADGPEAATIRTAVLGIFGFDEAGKPLDDEPDAVRIEHKAAAPKPAKAPDTPLSKSAKRRRRAKQRKLRAAGKGYHNN